MMCPSCERGHIDEDRHCTVCGVAVPRGRVMDIHWWKEIANRDDGMAMRFDVVPPMIDYAKTKEDK